MCQVRIYKPDENAVLQYHKTISREQLIADRDAREYGTVTLGKMQKASQLHTCVCAYCKKEFQSTNKNQKFHSKKFMDRKNSCSYLFNQARNRKPLIDKVCTSCKEPFKTRLSTQVFCGNPCTYHSIPVKRQKCACGGEFRTHRREITSCERCRK